MSVNFNNERKPTQRTNKNSNKKLIAEIIIALTIAVIVSTAIMYHVMSVQDAFDEAGIKFKKMNNGLALSSGSEYIKLYAAKP